MILALKEHPEERDKEELNILADMLRETSLLKERHLSDYLLQQLALEMEYLFVPKGEIVFEYGKMLYIYIYIYRFRR